MCQSDPIGFSCSPREREKPELSVERKGKYTCVMYGHLDASVTGNRRGCCKYQRSSNVKSMVESTFHHEKVCLCCASLKEEIKGDCMYRKMVDFICNKLQLLL